MKITILGCGTSTGVPLIGCNCQVCRSSNPKNRRTRTSVLVGHGENNILVDTATDLYSQCLANHVLRINAVLYTHTHADHIHGIDELRTFNYLQREIIPIFGSEETMEFIRRVFAYIFNVTPIGGGKPLLETNPVEEEFELFGLKILPLEIMHGSLPIFGYRFIEPGEKPKRFAYLTDCSELPEESKKELGNLDFLILDALRREYHPTHFTVEDATRIIAELRPGRAALTHFDHSIDYDELKGSLPAGIEPAYDGMVVEV
jgi:phosphoribosyl 1,2-cyclic phosphate phosphodiesterase